MLSSQPWMWTVCVAILQFVITPIEAVADRLELINHVNLWTGSPVRSADTAGIAYHPPSGRLLIVDSEINEYGNKNNNLSDHKPQREPSVNKMGEPVFSGYNMFEASLDLQTLFDAHLIGRGDQKKKKIKSLLRDKGTEPCGIAYNPIDGCVYTVDDDAKRVFRYRFDEHWNRKFGPPIAEFDTSFDGRYSDPEGIGCDPKTGILYVSSGTREERVLRLKFDTQKNEFVSLGDFTIADSFPDPEGIAVDPVSGNLFMISHSVGGIGEFTTDGKLIQIFDFSFLKGTGVSYHLPGGLTFAPSSDPNDHPDNQSIYITVRGEDNDSFFARNSLDGSISEVRLVREPREPTNALRVPADFPTIQAGIDAAPDGGTVVVAPGLYQESVVLAGKSITLTSEYFLTGRSQTIEETIIERETGKGIPLVWLKDTIGRETTVSGFTLRKGDYGIRFDASARVTDCYITENRDGINFVGGGGLVRDCRIWNNRDDGIDFDNDVDVLIEDCMIAGNGDDNIELRMQPYSGDPLEIKVRNCRIEGAGQDGIQLIGYETTDRIIRIEGNYFVDNGKAAIGCIHQASGSKQDFSAAAIAETVHVFNNTFIGNDHHISGGANMLVVNNIFANAGSVSVRNVSGDSRLLFNMFSGKSDVIGSTIDLSFTILADPMLDAHLRPRRKSPVIDAGRNYVIWKGHSVMVAPPGEWLGEAPDLGGYETR